MAHALAHSRGFRDPFGRLLGITWSLSVVAHVVFFAAFAFVAARTTTGPIDPNGNKALIFELADLPKGASMGADAPPKAQSAALNPFQSQRSPEIKEKLTAEDMPQHVKPVVKGPATKQRSMNTRLAQSAIERLKQQKAEQGGGGTGTGTGSSIAGIYAGQVRNKIKAKWSVPGGVSAEDLDRVGKVVVRIDENGNLIGADIVQPTGSDKIDASLRSAVSRASPFTRPPSEYADAIGSTGIHFSFKAKEAQ